MKQMNDARQNTKDDLQLGTRVSFVDFITKKTIEGVVVNQTGSKYWVEFYDEEGDPLIIVYGRDDLTVIH